MKSNRLKNILFYIVLLGMLIPMIQHMTHFANEKGLKGAVKDPKAPVISIDAWRNGTYQDSMDTYLNEAFGFRPDFVRIHNQIQYSLYGKAQARGVIIGKEWYLYEYNYIRAYYGLDFVGDSTVNSKIEKLEFIQDTLEKMNKQILVVLAPGKGSYLPEYFPDSSKHEKGRTNYEAYSERLKESRVNFVDFHHWFRTMKDETPYPLYPKGGIHWSKYGEILAADSMIKYIEKIGDFDLPDLVIDEFETSSTNKEGDYDIGEGMNILFQTPTYPMAYPKFHIEHPEKNTTKGLFIADSYYWGMFNYGFSNSIFGEGQFWFYNNEIYPDSFDEQKLVGGIDIRKEVESNDFIVLMSTDANLYKFAFGFIDRLYEAYK